MMLTPALLYLLKVSVYVMAFYIPFHLFFKGTTFFTINRIYLVTGLLLSAVLPLYEGVTVLTVYSVPDAPFMEPIATKTESVMLVASQAAGGFDAGIILALVYLAGIAFRVFSLSVSISHILKLRRQGLISRYRNIKVVRTATTVPFTFFNHVFLPLHIDQRAIMEHEAAHVTQYHWFDLLIVEIVSAMLWFNPVMIAYRRALKQQHEYLSDRAVIESGIGVADYLGSIRQHIHHAVSSALTSQFYFQSIKARIFMLTKKRTSSLKLVMYAIVLPLIVSLMAAFASREPLPIIGADETSGIIQDEIEFVLPIDRKAGFILESGYGERMHPVLGVKRLHTGIDLVANEGVPVVAASGGVVVKATLADAWGNIIVVRHNDTYSTSYSHLQSMKAKVGDEVQQGQVIGLVGHTGLSTKDHLHFEILKNAVAVDPIGYLPEMK